MLGVFTITLPHSITHPTKNTTSKIEQLRGRRGWGGGFYLVIFEKREGFSVIKQEVQNADTHIRSNK